MPLATPQSPQAIGDNGGTPRRRNTPQTAITARAAAASLGGSAAQGFGGPVAQNVGGPVAQGWGGPPPPSRGGGGLGGGDRTFLDRDRVSNPQPAPIPSGTSPTGTTADGRPYWTDPTTGMVTFQEPGTTPDHVYNPQGQSDTAIVQQQEIETSLAAQQQQMSDWLTGAMGGSMADYTGQMDSLWEQMNQFLPAQYGYQGDLLAQEFGVQADALGLDLQGNEAQQQHAQTAWDLLQQHLSNQTGTTGASWQEAQNYLGTQGQLAGQSWQDYVENLNNVQGTSTDSYNEALRWLDEQGGFAGDQMNLLIDALNQQRGTLTESHNLDMDNSERLGGQANELLDILSGQIGAGREGALRDVDLARLIADQNRETTTTGRDLTFGNAARAREAADWGRRSQSTSQGGLLSRGHALQMGRNQSAEAAARAAGNLQYTQGMNTIDASQQGAENQYVDALNALNTQQSQANLGYDSTMGDLQYGVDQSNIEMQAALAALEQQYNQGQLGYEQTMGGLQNQINTTGIGYQATLDQLQNQYNTGSTSYQGTMAGLQNQLNQGGIDYQSALNSLGNQFGVGQNNYNYAMAQGGLQDAGIANQLAGLGINQQQAQFGNDMSLWNAQQGINQQMSGMSQQAAQEWNAYMQQMIAGGYPQPTNMPMSPYGWTPPIAAVSGGGSGANQYM